MSTASRKQVRKRQRVSLACAHCRLVRRKCNGGRPSCNVCVSENRECEYAPSQRKRGLPLGYSKALESSLAYLLEQNPNNTEILESLLCEKSSIFQQRGRQLHQRWIESRFRERMSTLNLTLDGDLTYNTKIPHHLNNQKEHDDPPNFAIPTPANSESLFQESSGVVGPGDGSLDYIGSSSFRGILKLPHNWRNLLEVYFSYTYCWLPIMNEKALWSTALHIPTEGIPFNSLSLLSPCYAELWAAIALASFQVYSHEGTGACPRDLSPTMLFITSRRMMPCEHHTLRLPHVRALLLHSLVLMGQGEVLAAWLVIGTATRLALHLRETNHLESDNNTSAQQSRGESQGLCALAACMMLETFTSVHLGHLSFPDLRLREVDDYVEILGEGSEHQDWKPAFSSTFMPPLKFCPFKTLKQLYKIARFMRSAMPGQWLTSPNEDCEDLAQTLLESLDSDFTFCKSIIADRCTPLTPPALVVHVAFLVSLSMTSKDSTSLALTYQCRVVQRFTAELGVSSIPPIVSVLLTRAGNLVPMEMSDILRIEHNGMIKPLTAVWKQSDHEDASPALGSFPEQNSCDVLDEQAHDYQSEPVVESISPPWNLDCDSQDDFNLDFSFPCNADLDPLDYMPVIESL